MQTAPKMLADLIEVYQAAYEESERLRAIAWYNVEAAMLANSPVKIGDLVEYIPYSYSSIKLYTLRVTSVGITRDLYTGVPRWRVRAQMYPIKKDGTIAKVGSHVERDVHAATKAGTLRVLLTSAADCSIKD